MSYNQKSAGNLNINRYRGSVQGNTNYPRTQINLTPLFLRLETPEPKAVGDRLTLSGSNYKQTKTSARGRTAGASTCMVRDLINLIRMLTQESKALAP